MPKAVWSRGRPGCQHASLEDVETLAHTVVVAGCTPALALWARSAERWHAGLRVHWRAANSTTALESLARGEIHVAGTHLYDPDSTEYNVPFVRRITRTMRLSSSRWASGKKGSWSAQAIHVTSELSRISYNQV